MGLYHNWVLPRLLDSAMGDQILDCYRRSTITSARRLVLEIGVGSAPAAEASSVSTLARKQAR
jgi:hypothetical protein